MEFVSRLLSLLKVHLGLVAPLGFSCVQVACGQQVKSIRNLLLKLIDSQLPMELDKASAKDCLSDKSTFSAYQFVYKCVLTYANIAFCKFFDNELHIPSPFPPSPFLYSSPSSFLLPFLLCSDLQ